MKLTRYVLGFALAVPVLSGAQATGNGASPEMKAAYESMQLNVARIAPHGCQQANQHVGRQVVVAR